MPTRSEIFRSSRTDKQGRPMNAAVGRIFVSNNWSMISIIVFLMRFYLNLPLQEQLDALVSEDPDTSGPHDHLSQVLGPEHSGRVRYRPGYIPTSYRSEVSSSSHAFGAISREQLDEAWVKVDQAG